MVVFDVDGTLYDLSRVRLAMVIRMALDLVVKPSLVRDFFMLRKFRKQRKKLAGLESDVLDRDQYSIIGKAIGCDPDRLRSLVEYWMIEAPLRHVAVNMFPSVREFVSFLQQRGIATTFLSDYPATRKLEIMGMDASNAYYAGDDGICCFKPSPKGLSNLMANHSIDPSACLVIGDSPELDGKMAGLAGARFLPVKGRGFYKKLLRNNTWPSYT